MSALELPDDEFTGDIPYAATDQPAAATTDSTAAPPALFYATLPAFVEGVIAATFRRDVDGRELTWCPQWWKHTEAITRLEALWRSWEHLRQDPATGISVWLLMHADPHMAVLLSRDGPFGRCSPKKGHTERTPPLPCDPPPAGVFD